MGVTLTTGTSYTSGAGIDVTSTVDAILDSKRTPETYWKQEQSTISTQEAALKSLQSQISSLEDAFNDLRDSAGVFSGLTAASTDESLVTATASTSAAAGTHTIVVNSLVSTSVVYSKSLASAGSTFDASDLTFTVGTGSEQTVALSGTMTLSEAATAINKSAIGVTASVQTDSSGARLVITSNSSGASGNITMSNSPSVLALTVQPGVDASATVDGVPVTSSSNRITTIAGVSLDLHSISSANVTVTIAPDAAKITNAINSFVSDYNAIISGLNSQFQSNSGSSKTSTAGVLQTDPTARDLQSQLLSAVANVTGGNASFKTLSAIGIKMQDDGTLSVDSDALNSAVNNHASDLQSFFQSTTSGSFAQFFSDLLSNLTDTTDSPIVLDLNGLENNYDSLQSNIDDLELQLASLKDSLTDKYSLLDAALKTLPSTLNQINTLLGNNDSKSNS